VERGEFIMNHYQIAREALTLYGQEEAQLQNLLAVLIGPEAEPAVTGELAALGVDGLSQLSREELMNFPGICAEAAERILAALSFGFLFTKHKKKARYILRSPDDAYKYLEDMSFLQQEHFDVVYLNSINEVVGRRNIFKGTINACVVYPREVFKEAYKLGAAAIICAHNHPTGSPIPSREDIEVTKRLAEVGRILGIEMLDHIIIGHGCFTSLKEKGYC
jgi:DNA repair protein RadC